MAGQPKSPKSGGPKTQVGKVVASQNSLNAALEQLFIDDLRPIGVVEFALVQSLVKITWKKLRLEKMEVRVIVDCLAKLPGLSDLQKTGVENYPASSESYVANRGKLLA